MKKERYKLQEVFEDGSFCWYLKDTDTKELIPLVNLHNCVDLLNQQDARIKELKQENLQLKDEIRQLKFDCTMYKTANHFINHFGIDKAREVMFQSEQKLKQSQNSKAIKVLEGIRRYLDYEVRTSKFSYNEYVDFVNLVLSSHIDILLCKQNDKKD